MKAHAKLLTGESGADNIDALVDDALKRCQDLAATKSPIQMASDHPMNVSSIHWMVTGTARAKKPTFAPTQLARDYGIVVPVSRVTTPIEANA